MKPKAKIIHIIQSLGSGGCENMLLRTLPHLKDDFEHIIMTLKEPGELAPQFEAQGIPVIQVEIPLSMFGLADGKRLARAVADQKPAIVLTYLFHADVFGRLFLQKETKAPVVPFLRTTYNFARYWPARLFEKLTRGRVTHYFANSDAVKRFYVTQIGVKEDKITVIPNGINVAALIEAGTKGDSPLPVRKNALVVTCVANLAPNKGHRTLLAAFEAIAGEFPLAELVLVGEGEERTALESIQKVSAYKDRIHLLGRRRDVPSILQHTDIFVLPTLFEGLSNALQEAMAAGCACVTTDIPENRILIRHEKTGLLVPAQDMERLTQALRTLLANADVRQAYGRAAKKFIDDNFDLKQVAGLWIDAITQIMKHAEQEGAV